MKKLLSILGMIGMVATTTSVAVACKPIGQKEPNKEEKKKKLLNKKKLFYNFKKTLKKLMRILLKNVMKY